MRAYCRLCLLLFLFGAPNGWVLIFIHNQKNILTILCYFHESFLVDCPKNDLNSELF